MLLCVFFLMIRRPPRSTRTDTLFPYTPLFRSRGQRGVGAPCQRGVSAGVSALFAQAEFVLPISTPEVSTLDRVDAIEAVHCCLQPGFADALRFRHFGENQRGIGAAGRSEEHTSELQSLMRISYAVICLKKKNHNNITN